MKKIFKERMTAVKSRCLINKTNEKHEHLTLWHYGTHISFVSFVPPTHVPE